MPADTMIHPFPELVKLAEEEARAMMVARALPEWERRTRSAPRPMPEWWAAANKTECDSTARVITTLLCDLTRPASRDAVARLVAGRVGLKCWATAPSLYWMPERPGSRDRDGAPEGDDWPPGWWLSNELGDRLFFTGADWCPDDHTEIAGLPDGNERATEALSMIVRHLWPPENSNAR